MDGEDLDQELTELAPPAAPGEPPAPIVAGSFAIYLGPKKEIILVTDISGRGTERRVFPARMVRLVAASFGKLQHVGHAGD